MILRICLSAPRGLPLKVAALHSGPSKHRAIRQFVRSPMVISRVVSTHAGQPEPDGPRSKLRSVIELMRWHKPTGVILALTPSLWAVGLATPVTSMFPDIQTVAIFTAGAIVARGLGCTINDILDWKYDRLVDRTKNRPIARGDISVREALVYLALQSSVGLAILCMNNMEVIKLGLLCSVMISTYPLFKRFTHWPQVMLALTINWGVIMGFAAVQDAAWLSSLHCVLPLYIGSICWTLYYDTIYAHQDKTDDMFIGIKSTALGLGIHSKRFLGQTASSMFASLYIAGLLTSQLWPYYLSIASTGIYQANQIRNLDLNDKDDCWTAFDRQKYVGWTILGGVLASVALKSYRNSGEKDPLNPNKLL